MSNPFEIEEHDCLTFGHVFAKSMVFPKAGTEKPWHIHNFDHLTVIGRGAFKLERVRVDGTRQTEHLRAPAIVTVQQGEEHRLSAAEDGSIAFCIETTVVPREAVDRAETVLNTQQAQ